MISAFGVDHGEVIAKSAYDSGAKMGRLFASNSAKKGKAAAQKTRRVTNVMAESMKRPGGMPAEMERGFSDSTKVMASYPEGGLAHRRALHLRSNMRAKYGPSGPAQRKALP